MAMKYCRKLQLPEKGARTIQTRRICDNKDPVTRTSSSHVRVTCAIGLHCLCATVYIAVTEMTGAGTGRNRDKCSGYRTWEGGVGKSRCGDGDKRLSVRKAIIGMG